jgi:RNA polymerase sigma-70 factor, ECF subfamily
MDARRGVLASFSPLVRQQRVEDRMHRHDTPPTALDGLDDLDAGWTDTLDRLRAFVTSRVDNRELAADIVQDVLVRSIASGALQRVDDPVAWLYRSARNAVIDHYRTRRTYEPIVDEDRWPDPDSSADVPNDATRELSRCLQPMLDRLTPAARDALMRVDVDGHPHHRVADDLGLSVSGMKSRVQRARRELKQLLEQCCAVAQDGRGAVADYEPRNSSCDCATTPLGST